MTDRLAVVGSPIAHSKSPVLHRAAYSVLGRDWQYNSAELQAAELRGFVGGLDASWRGLSLTMPLKNAAFEISDAVDDTARLTGAVNTLRFRDGRASGFNTDVAGIVRAVNAAGLDSAHRVLILGSGATAASALVAAASLGASHIEVAARTPERAEPLHGLAERLDLHLSIRRFSAEDVSTDAELVVSTLPGGVASPEHYSAGTRETALLLDVAYSPWPSHLAVHWGDASGRVINGLAMLVHQALLQVRIFDTGDPEEPLPAEPSVLAAMREAVQLPVDGLMPARR